MLEGENLGDVARRWAFEASKRRTIRIGDLAGLLGERGVAGLLAVLAAACAVAGTVPMLSSIIGLPMLFLAVWLAAGGEEVALPNWISDRKLKAASVARAFRKAAWLFASLERYMKPRSGWIFVLFGRRAIGIVAILLCLILFLPIPFMNFLPSISLVVLLAGWVAGDGLVFLVALGFGGLTLAILPIASATLAKLL